MTLHNSPPLVSVIIPVRDGRRFLLEALESILRQTRPAEELIVIDDGSSDGSLEIARAVGGVRAVRQPQLGQAAALNHGVQLARGQYLAFLDADDRWLPDKLERQLALFEDDPQLELAFGHARQFRNLGPEPTAAALPARLPSALLIRRSAFERVGPFSSQFELGAVIEWCARADDAGLRSKCLEQVVYERRLHDANLGVRRAGQRGEYARMLKTVLDRRRREKQVGD
jgi:glycosyltransferase involved in cell wall biosynthesis